MNRKTSLLIAVILTLLLAAWLSPAVPGQEMTMETATPQATAAPATPAWSDDQLPLGSGRGGAGGMNMGSCPMMNGTMDGTMAGGMGNMAGMSNMAGMANMPGMGTMPGMGNMAGMTNMPGMAARPGMTSGLPLDDEGNIAWGYVNPWWLLGWSLLAVWGLGLVAGSLGGLLWLFQRFRPVKREVQDGITESQPA